MALPQGTSNASFALLTPYSAPISDSPAQALGSGKHCAGMCALPCIAHAARLCGSANCACAGAHTPPMHGVDGLCGARPPLHVAPMALKCVCMCARTRRGRAMSTGARPWRPRSSTTSQRAQSPRPAWWPRTRWARSPASWARLLRWPLRPPTSGSPAPTPRCARHAHMRACRRVWAGMHASGCVWCCWPTSVGCCVSSVRSCRLLKGAGCWEILEDSWVLTQVCWKCLRGSAGHWARNSATSCPWWQADAYTKPHLI